FTAIVPSSRHCHALITLDPISSFYRYRAHRDLHSFPTRRSSDLAPGSVALVMNASVAALATAVWLPGLAALGRVVGERAWSLTVDRKSTRLNSSHVKISYAVFCLKKKNTRQSRNTIETSD